MEIVSSRHAVSFKWVPMRGRAWLAALTAMLVVLADGGRAQADPAGYRFGYRVDGPPFSYRGDGGPQGYSVDLCEVIRSHLIDVLGAEAVAPGFVALDAGNRLSALAEGKVDILCAATTVTLDRRRQMDFSIPVFLDGVTVAVRADASGDLAELGGPWLDYDMLRSVPPSAGLDLGVLAETTTEQFLRSVYAGTRAPKITLFESHEAAFGALAAGEIDAYAVSLAIGRSYARSGGADVAVSANPLTYEPIAIGTRLGDATLRLLVDEALSEVYLEGGIGDIFRKHFGGGGNAGFSDGLFEGFFVKQALE